MIIYGLVLSIKVKSRFKGSKKPGDQISNMFWYILLSFLILSMMFTEKIIGSHKTYWRIIDIVSTIFHFTFLGKFILNEIKFATPPQPRYYLISQIIFAVFYIGSIYWAYHELMYNDLLSYYFSSLGLFILSTFYVVMLFQSPKENSYFKDPSFWIIIGVFIFSLISLPITMISLFFLNSSPLFFVVIKIILAISFFILYSFFIKGLLCSLTVKR